MIQVESFGIAALLDYAAIDWITCDARGKNVIWTFDTDEATLTRYRDAWTSKAGQPLTNARVYFESCKRLDFVQQKTRNSTMKTQDNRVYLGLEKKAV